MKQLDHAYRPARRAPPVPRPRPLEVRSGAPGRRATSTSSSPVAAESEEHGVYPCPFGYALNVTLHRSEALVPVTGDSAASLVPIADALALVRESGGFEAKAVRLPTAEIRLIFERVPDLARATRRLHTLAGDLLAVGMDAVPAHDPSLGFRAAIELRAPSAHSLSVHLYVEGTSSAHERLLSCLAAGALPALARLVEGPARVETHFILRRRVIARCRVDLARLFARASAPIASDPIREDQAIRQALGWLGAARREPVLASAQNELVLANAARMARALGQDARGSSAEGHCHAVRFGSLLPLASFSLDGSRLLGVLELPLGVDSNQRRRDDDAELAQRLVREHSSEDRALLSACLGLAAHLATLQAATSLALSGASPARHSVEPAGEDSMSSVMNAEMPDAALPLPIDWEARRSSLPPPPVEPRAQRPSTGALPPPRRSAAPLDPDRTQVTPLGRLAADIEKSLAPAPEDLLQDLENTVVTPARSRSLPAVARATTSRPRPLSAARAPAASPSRSSRPAPPITRAARATLPLPPAPAPRTARATLLPPPAQSKPSASRPTLLPPPPVAPHRPASARAGVSQLAPRAQVAAPARRAGSLPPPPVTPVAPPRPSSRATSGLPPRKTSSPPPLESLVAPRPVAGALPSRSARDSAPAPGASTPPAPSGSMGPPPRRYREDSGIHPAARDRQTLPPPRHSTRRREWG